MAAASAQSPQGTVGKHHKRIIFPVLGRSAYIDDFGAPRPGGSHQGIDIMAPRKALAVAAEAGRVEFWTHSASAGCMLYLYGRSGTTYYYIHLNNDRTNHNDNQGGCGPGMSYAPHLHDGSRVQAGQVLGFVGDSGDANGIHPHLHFEVHPGGGGAHNPYPYLNKGRRLLFGTLPGPAVRIALSGAVVQVDGQFLTLRVRSLVVWPGKLHVRQVSRSVSVYVPVDALIAEKLKGRRTTATVSLSAATKARRLTVTTTFAAPSLPMLLGKPNTLTAKKVLLAAAK